MRPPRVMECLGLSSLLLWGASAVILRRAASRARWLEETPPLADSECPTLSVVLAACNEGPDVEETFRSVLNSDYPGLDVIAVEDRSTDETGAILDAMAAKNDRLRVIHVTDLPAGWMGKSHALWTGSRATTAEFVLFTDVGVHYGPDLLRRAMAVVLDSRADHIVVIPRVIRSGFWEHLLFSYYDRLLYHLLRRSWQVENPESTAFVGAGAFNLLRRTTYESFGGHTALATDFMEDVRIGKLVKRSGGRQVMAIGGPLLRKRWLSGLRGIVRGLTKNIFAGLDYRWDRVITATVLLVPTHILPAVGILWGTRLSRALFAGAFVFMVATADARTGQTEGGRTGLLPAAAGAPALSNVVEAACGLGYPLSATIFLYILWQAALKAQLRGAVEWRGTRYNLRELKQVE
ncbi:MAG: glycosyltransferase family 2 protein [Chloroflexi bacterium]|nr:glycosyltransferase family 2 protein [Chloroflexota bacterium]